MKKEKKSLEKELFPLEELSEEFSFEKGQKSRSKPHRERFKAEQKKFLNFQKNEKIKGNES